MDTLHLCRFPPEADPLLADERSPKDGVKKSHVLKNKQM